jgi:hypothetical protein
MDLICQTCCGSRTGDVLGAPCQTPGCKGIIEKSPDFNDLVDTLPEPMTCGRRAESGMDVDGGPFKRSGKNLDHWRKFKAPHGNRVCSYCGSLHPDDMFALVKQAAEAPEDAEHNSVVEIEPSDKGYKIYVHQPGVRNAHEGGIKFYTQHLPRDADGKMIVSEERQAEYSKAVKASHKRFERRMAMQYGKVGTTQ